MPDTVYLVTNSAGGGGNSYVVRVTNADAANPADAVYTNLGQVDTDQLYWIALDEFDPANRAMVCGREGVWSTQNLADATPAWVKRIARPVGYDGFPCVRSSPVEDGLWMAILTDQANVVYAYWTDDDGATWNSREIASGVCGLVPLNAWGAHLEMSQHDADVAWVSYVGNDATLRVVKTTDRWATATCYTESTCNFNWTGITSVIYPTSHHRYTNNDDDLVAIWGGRDYSVAANRRAKIMYCEGDIAAPTSCASFCHESDPSSSSYWVPSLGCWRYSANWWWALVQCRTPPSYFPHFYVSNDGENWTLQAAQPHNAICAFDAGNNQNKYYTVEAGNTGPLRISLDRGVTWQQQTGNWNTLCTDEGWGSPLTRHGALMDLSGGPFGNGLPDQALAVDGNGDILYIALYDVNSNPELLTVPLPLDPSSSIATSRYAPGAGDAINVKSHYLVGNFSIIAGHFGNNEQARRSEDGGVTYSDIDPDTWVANRAQPIAIDPNDEEHVLLALDGNDDLVEKDVTDTWTTLDAALPFDVGAMAIFDLDPNEIVIARIDAGTPMVQYSPNNGVGWADISGALPVTDGIASIELV